MATNWLDVRTSNAPQTQLHFEQVRACTDPVVESEQHGSILPFLAMEHHEDSYLTVLPIEELVG